MKKLSLENFTSLPLKGQLNNLLQIFENIKKHNKHSKFLLEKMKENPTYFTKDIMKSIYKECLSIHGEKGVRLHTQKIQHITTIHERERQDYKRELKNTDNLLNF